MTETVYIVTFGDPDKPSSEVWGFNDEQMAEDFAGVRGGCEDILTVYINDEHEAKRMIKAEAKERAEEERVDRWLAEH